MGFPHMQIRETLLHHRSADIPASICQLIPYVSRHPVRPAPFENHGHRSNECDRPHKLEPPDQLKIAA